MLIHTTAQASTLASVEKHNEKTVPKLYVTTTIQVNATGRPMSSARRSLFQGMDPQIKGAGVGKTRAYNSWVYHQGNGCC